MAISDVLSKDEVNTLLDDKEDNQTDTNNTFADSDRYDFSESHRRKVQESAALKIIDVATLDEFQSALSNLFRYKVEMREAASDLMEFTDFLNRQSGTLTLNVLDVKEFNSSLILVTDSKLIFATIEVLFGGNLKNSIGLEKKLGKIDRTVSNIIVDRLAHALQKAWKTVRSLTFTPGKSVVNPLFAPDISNDAKVFVNRYEVIIDEVSTEIELCIPKTIVEQINDNYRSGEISESEARSNQAWHKALKESVFDTSIDVTSYLPDIKISLKELMNLKEGDTIAIRDPNVCQLCIEDIYLFSGKCGNQNGNHAIEITGLLTEE